jgi:hypothetical protein
MSKGVKMIEKRTGVDSETIKKCIWFVESGVNFRKPKTIEDSKKYSNENWLKIKSKINMVREILVSEYC